MKSLFKTDDGISSKDEDDFDDEMKWYESEPEMDALSDSNNETYGSDPENLNADGSVSQEVRGKVGYLWRTKPKIARRTLTPNIVSSTPCT